MAEIIISTVPTTIATTTKATTATPTTAATTKEKATTAAAGQPGERNLRKMANWRLLVKGKNFKVSNCDFWSCKNTFQFAVKFVAKSSVSWLWWSSG